MATQRQTRESAPFVSFAAGDAPLSVSRDHDGVVVDGGRSKVPVRYRLHEAGGLIRPVAPLPADIAEATRVVFAAVDAGFAWWPERRCLMLSLDDRPDVAAAMTSRGDLVEQDGALVAHHDMIMQQAAGWLSTHGAPPFPQSFVTSSAHRHPRRPPQPSGVVYARFIPWLGQTLSFRVATLADDLARFHDWMNARRVAEFWGEAGTMDAHASYLQGLIEDPHTIPLIASLDGFAFAYFEVYWAKENRLAPFYDAGDYDRGWHVAVGEDSCRGRDYVGAWLPSIVHYMFLDDARTQRIVGEPAAAHHRQIRNLERSGFARIKTFEFPHKTAALVSLLRERFFADRLWIRLDPDVSAEQPIAEA